jgi:predicted membrane protein
MKKKTTTIRKIAWGIFLMGAAILIIANAYYNFAEFFPLLCGLILLPIIIESLVHLSFTGVFIPAALLGIVFAEQLGIEAITPWPILAAAVLLSIGFSIIFRKKEKWFGYIHLEEDETFENIDDDEMTCNVKFSGSSKFIQSENFEKAYINCSFGGVKIYFDNAKLSPDGAELYISSTFGGIELYIPRHWKVTNSVLAVAGGVEEKSRNIPDPDSPVLNIKGNIRFAGIVIYYI